MEWLKSIAPLLGTALGGPLGGAAASFIASKLGIQESTIEAVSEVLNSGKMSADQIAQIKIAEIEFQKFLAQNKIDLAKLDVEDRQGARHMQETTRSYIPGTLAVLVTIGFFGILIALMEKAISPSNELLIMLGSLGTAWTMIIGFYFGSSHGSQNKDVLLAGK